jgi:hypothetical protein
MATRCWWVSARWPPSRAVSAFSSRPARVNPAGPCVRRAGVPWPPRAAACGARGGPGLPPAGAIAARLQNAAPALARGRGLPAAARLASGPAHPMEGAGFRQVPLQPRRRFRLAVLGRSQELAFQAKALRLLVRRLRLRQLRVLRRPSAGARSAMAQRAGLRQAAPALRPARPAARPKPAKPAGLEPVCRATRLRLRSPAQPPRWPAPPRVRVPSALVAVCPQQPRGPRPAYPPRPAAHQPTSA